MKYRVSILEQHEWDSYESYVMNHSHSMLPHSKRWLALIQSMIHCQPHAIVVWDNDQIVGTLPFFISQDKGHGSVLNSLPFFGSQSGILADSDNAEVIFSLILKQWDQTANDYNCVASTIIASMVDQNTNLYRTIWNPSFEDERVGQMVDMPSNPESLMQDFFVGKRRNNIRNAQRKGVIVSEGVNETSLGWLRQKHEEVIGFKEGIVKPPAFFDWCVDAAQDSSFCKFYFASVEERLAAGMIIFYYKNYVEYCLPVIDHQYSSFNPLALLIYEGMVDAIKNGKRFWNFGGTWLSQTNLYRFKKEFGADDYPYSYFTRVYDERILTWSPQRLLEAFPYFFVVPFSHLKQTG